MNKSLYALLALCLLLLSPPAPVYAEHTAGESIIVATGENVPTDDHLPQEYRFPAKYRENAVQFRTEDGVLLCGYVIGEGDKGVTLGHANGWGVNSWLPFGERLVDAGYMVILWSFRDNLPSGSSPERRWDLDVLAAAQVLRERGATQILAMGASDGGNATAVAAPYIPELAGLAILSSPAGSIGDGPAALSHITVPAFFAVSVNDPGGNFLPEVQSLYDACASEQKEFHTVTSYEHGTDLLSDQDKYSSGAYGGSTEEQKQERRQLADDLMRFVGDTFSAASKTEENSALSTPAPASAASSVNSSTSMPPAGEENGLAQSGLSSGILWGMAGAILLGIPPLTVWSRRARRKRSGQKER